MAEVKSFTHCIDEKATEFRHIWKLKNKENKWSIGETANPYTCGTRWCDLSLPQNCLLQKLTPRLNQKQSEPNRTNRKSNQKLY